jgi:5-formyltetrahydrofolate cyclo-ligase
LNRLLGKGLVIFVPVSQPAGALEWVRLVLGATEGLVTDSAGMPVPAEGERIGKPEVEAVFVPAAAVDRDGNRLGWGKGYYDRFLENTQEAAVIAVVFEADLFEQIPTEAHDHPVNLIVTESDIYTV